MPCCLARVDGEYVLFHRPVTAITSRADIWLSRSADLRSWSSPEPVLAARPGGWWDSARIGIGPPPLETSEGWLVVYHGVRQTVAGALYRAGLALLDLDDPSKVLRRCSEWVLGPTESYELMGDVPGVVFPCGLIHDAENRRAAALLRRRRHVHRDGHGLADRRAHLCARARGTHRVGPRRDPGSPGPEFVRVALAVTLIAGSARLAAGPISGEARRRRGARR